MRSIVVATRSLGATSTLAGAMILGPRFVVEPPIEQAHGPTFPIACAKGEERLAHCSSNIPIAEVIDFCYYTVAEIQETIV